MATTKKVVVSSTVRRCKCKHEFQDQQYGNGQRLFKKVHYPNVGQTEYRCTVCGDVQL